MEKNYFLYVQYYDFNYNFIEEKGINIRRDNSGEENKEVKNKGIGFKTEDKSA